MLLGHQRQLCRRMHSLTLPGNEPKQQFEQAIAILSPQIEHLISLIQSTQRIS